MCRYCKNYNKASYELDIGDTIIISSARYTEVGDGYEYIVPMRYCPNCGNKLKMDGDNN